MDEQRYFQRISEYKLLAKKEVGQNFLIDPKVASNIVSLLDCQEGEEAIEIGCGAGSLSFFLAQTRANTTLIDIDEGLLTKLKNDFQGLENVKIEQQNALKVDYAPYRKIVGNLPYYITSALIERVLLTAVNAMKIVFMVQKEAANRILAKVGTKDYSPLNVLLNLYGTCKREFNVGHDAFAPAPHVNSTVFSLVPKHELEAKELQGVYSLCCALFAERRKTIANNLKKQTDDAPEVLGKAKINPSSRPENLTENDYLTLYRLLKGKDNQAK